jgi:phenylacetaldehyde dehydrogenase
MNEVTTISRAQLEYSGAVKKALARKPQLYINGEWVDSSGGATIDVEDPSSGKVISSFVEATDKDIDRAIAAARTAFDDGRWRNLPPLERERTMHKIADLIEAHADELAELEAIDVGKPKGMASVVDVPGAAAHFRYMAGWAGKIGGETQAPYAMPGGVMFGYTLKEPVGVCAQIVPWNFPLLMACLKLAPVLASGCTSVLKPAEQTSLTALRLADLIHEAGVPAGVINIVTGYGHTAGDRMVKHPDVDKVAFTGSTEIGKLINRNATETLKHVTLELGGKSPVVVMPDVDVASTAPGVAGAIFFNSGQVCVAGSRLYAHKSVFDEVIEGMAATAGLLGPARLARSDRAHGPAGQQGAARARARLHRGRQARRRERADGRRCAFERRRLLRQPDDPDRR